MKKRNNTMKKASFFTLATLMSFSFITTAQITTVDCDLMGLVVNVGSNANSINLYHPGGYLTWPPEDNVMEWEFTDSEGNVLHEETIVNFSFVSFSFDIQLPDPFYVSVLLTNETAILNGNSVACLIEDYLFWEETEIIPGTFAGSWTLGGSVGVDVNEPATCFDPNLLDPSMVCAEIYEPVCGCDGITYSNSCYATYSGGVTSWEDGPCIAIEYGGCVYPLACNYDPNAFFDDGTCTFPPNDCSWPDTWANGCTYSDAINYDEGAATDDGSCVWSPCIESTCPGDIDGDSVVAIGDLLSLLAVFGSSCEETIEPNYSMEGKWLWSPTVNVEDANTMYEFLNGIRYKYYCSAECDETFWNSLDTSDAIPGTNNYSFFNDILIVDLNGNELVTPITFDCYGEKANFLTPGYSLYKVGTDCE